MRQTGEEPSETSPVPNTGRSLDSEAYQNTAGPVAILRCPVTLPGHTGWHTHRRCQLLYATSGLMIITTDRGLWLVPTGHALLIAAQVPHDSSCRAPLELCTAYIEPTAIEDCVPAGTCRMVRVSPLLDASLRALAEETAPYDPEGRTGLLTRVILGEIDRAEDSAFALPMPEDPRLRRICEALVASPALEYGIDEWAGEVGLSRRTLTRRFRAETALSLSEWRRRLRAARAAIHRVEGTPLQIAANDVGYRSVHALRAMMARSQAGFASE